MAKPRLSRQEAKENDWSLLEAMFGQCLPMQFRNVMGDASLGKQEQRICVLVCLKYRNFCHFRYVKSACYKCKSEC